MDLIIFLVILIGVPILYLLLMLYWRLTRTIGRAGITPTGSSSIEIGTLAGSTRATPAVGATAAVEAATLADVRWSWAVRGRTHDGGLERASCRPPPRPTRPVRNTS